MDQRINACGKYRNLLFTVNNYSDEQYDRFLNHPWFKYCVIGKEVAPTTGTPHFHCYAELGKQRRFRAIHREFPGADVRARKGSQQQCIDYCKKDNTWEERGEKNCQGCRPDRRKLLELAKAHTPFSTVLEENDLSFTDIKYYDRFFKIRDMVPITTVANQSYSSIVTDMPGTSNHPDWVDISTLFEAYRVCAMKLTWIPSIVANATLTQVFAPMYVFHERNDPTISTTPTPQQALQYESCKVFDMQKRWRYYRKMIRNTPISLPALPVTQNTTAATFIQSVKYTRISKYCKSTGYSRNYCSNWRSRSTCSYMR